MLSNVRRGELEGEGGEVDFMDDGMDERDGHCTSHGRVEMTCDSLKGLCG